MMTPALATFHAARRRIADAIHMTPVMTSTTLAQLAGAASFTLKAESLQKTGSFKVRGGLNAVAQLDDDARRRGVITFSAGNHAQGLAYAARAFGVHCTVVMPASASRAKAEASAGYGARVILHGANTHEIVERTQRLQQEHGYTFISAFDHADVIAGAGTVGLEILEQVPEVDVIVVPVGGGGLLAGIATAVGQVRPSVRVVGVEPEGASSMHQSLAAGAPVRLTSTQTIADGLAAPFAGELTYPLIRDHADGVLLVSDDEIAHAMAMILARCKLLAEPAGAAATAALLAHKVSDIAGKHVVAILSGGNVDLDRLKTLI
jgi:threonine dehydratase